MKYIPGPWQLYADLPSAEPNWHILTSESRLQIIANVHIEPGNETDAASARLLQSAPDLLEALRECLSWGLASGDPSQHRDYQAVRAKADAAIAKAVGP